MPSKKIKKMEGAMPIQWTDHIPQALQRHGGRLRPLADAEADEAMVKLLQAFRLPAAVRVEDQAVVTPAARPSSP
jgi:hypothetical protein